MSTLLLIVAIASAVAALATGLFWLALPFIAYVLLLGES